jgi:apolipoprotein D and lipocalin family protein
MKQFLIFFAPFFLLASCRTIPKGVKPIVPFDINRYVGTWYEIGRKNHKFERGLSRVTATYTLDENGRVKVENKGYNSLTGRESKATGKAKLVNEGKEGRLKVSFFGPFYSPYNIIAIDPEYENAMVIGRDKTYFWLLSKNTEMPEEIKQRYLQIAEEYKIKTDNIIWVKQD